MKMIDRNYKRIRKSSIKYNWGEIIWKGEY